MTLEKPVRKPQQKRSTKTKEKILDTALELFCKNGYHKTTTNEIAKVAGVSIGSLYAYFKDKDTVFLEILERYSSLFEEVHKKSMQDMQGYEADKRQWLYRFIEGMVKIHRVSKELNQEIKVLAHSRPDVAAVSQKQRNLSIETTKAYFQSFQKDFTVNDLDAAAIVAFNMISSSVDYIVFENKNFEEKRIIDATVEALYKFLLL